MTPKDFQNLAGSNICFVVFEGIRLEEFHARTYDQKYITFYIEEGKENSANAPLCKITNLQKQENKSPILCWQYSPGSEIGSRKWNCGDRMDKVDWSKYFFRRST